MDGKVASAFHITNEMWARVNQFNKDMLENYLADKIELSAETKRTYRVELRIFMWWVSEFCENKPVTEIKKRDFVKYLNWNTNRGLSDSAIRMKKASCSGLCNYILLMYEDEYPTFRSFVTSDMKIVKTGLVHEKKPLTPDEIKYLCDVLENRGEYEKLAYVLFTYSTGCRRAETAQLLKEVVDRKPIIKEVTYVDEFGEKHLGEAKIYLTNKIRCKGASRLGKVRQLKFDQQAMDAINKWLEVRGDDDCPYVFTAGQGKYIRQACPHTFNFWCYGEFSEIIGRRVYPHLLRASRATNLVVYEHKSSKVAQKLLGHEDVSTTEKHYIIKEDDDNEMDVAFI